MNLLTSTLAAAANASTEAPRSGDQQLLDIDGTVFVMLGLFVLTTLILSRWLWRPYLSVREQRVTRVEGYRAEAARLETEAQSRLTRIEAQLAEARRAGSAERGRARNEAQSREATIVADAQSGAARTLADARVKLESAFAAERGKLQEHAGALGREISEKILERKVAS